MAGTLVLLALTDSHVAKLVAQGALMPAGYRHVIAKAGTDLAPLIEKHAAPILVLDTNFEKTDTFALLERLHRRYPLLRVILLSHRPAEDALRGLRLGVYEILQPPLHTSALLLAIKRVQEERLLLEQKVIRPIRQDTLSLQQRAQAFQKLAEVAQMVTSSLSLDQVLKAAVDAAVLLTEAQEGSLLLLDEQSGELYVRAERNLDDRFTKTFRLRVDDSLAGKVLATGKPLLVSRQGPQKIKTAYLVQSLIYAPLSIGEKVIGVLGVDHQTQAGEFTREHLTLVSALANFAAIAIENARLYAETETERDKLNTILTSVRDGVVVVDDGKRVIFINAMAAEIFNVDRQEAEGTPIGRLVSHDDFLSLVENASQQLPDREEIHLPDGRFFSVQGASIPHVGTAFTLHDITHIKELDRLKGEFISTVSHDLRSPLTAIMGYIELLGRIGPLTEQQQTFVERVQNSVANITALVNQLLDLGRIEAGFDTHKELIDIGPVVDFAAESMQPLAEKKSQDITLHIAAELPAILANPARIQQVAENLIGNAIQYTPSGGRIEIRVYPEEHQLILQVSDNGPGIPPADQPYVFDKFYRGSNVADESSGTGLGLAIVKSIVEAHNGRVWVESKLGEGTTFTVVFPSELPYAANTPV